MREYYVDTPEKLEELCDRLRGAAAIALDTEFMREKTYYAQLSLLQICNGEIIACVDPLALPDLAPLMEILYDTEIQKVMHAARQDLEIFFDLCGELPRPVFDTQVGATLLGYGDQVSYATLVRDVLGVELEKFHTRTNWSQRPLDSGQIIYAQDDVRYLLTIWQRQLRQLEDMGRGGWLDEDFHDLTDIRLYTRAPREAWRRIRGIRILKGIQLAALRELAAWREERARETDKPRKWVVRDDVLVDLARRMPETDDQLRSMRGLEMQVIKRMGAEILEQIRKARALSETDWPTLGYRFTPTPAQEALVDAMMAMVRLCGLQNSVSPSALATRRDLEQLLTGRTDHALMHGWRGKLVGRDLQAFLRGEAGIKVDNKNLSVEFQHPG